VKVLKIPNKTEQPNTLLLLVTSKI